MRVNTQEAVLSAYMASIGNARPVHTKNSVGEAEHFTLTPVTMYWTWISRFRRVGGRKGVSKEVRAPIFSYGGREPTWGAPRIHGELLKLGCVLNYSFIPLFLAKISSVPEIGRFR